MRELLVPVFWPGLEIPIGVGGLTLNDPLTGKVVPSTKPRTGFSMASGKGPIIDGSVVPRATSRLASAPSPAAAASA